MPNAPVQARLTPDELDALDNYRRKQQNPPSRARAARELIRLALAERKGTGVAKERAA